MLVLNIKFNLDIELSDGSLEIVLDLAPENSKLQLRIDQSISLNLSGPYVISRAWNQDFRDLEVIFFSYNKIYKLKFLSSQVFSLQWQFQRGKFLQLNSRVTPNCHIDQDSM